MERYIARQNLITRLAGLGWRCSSLSCATANRSCRRPMPSPISDHRDGPILPPSVPVLPPIGFVPGQTLRITVAHVSTESRQDQNPPDVRVGVWLLDARGRVIAQSDEIAIPPGEFRSFDFNRDSIPLAGEPGTGRLQVRGEIRHRLFAIVDRTKICGLSRIG